MGEGEVGRCVWGGGGREGGCLREGGCWREGGGAGGAAGGGRWEGGGPTVKVPANLSGLNADSANAGAGTGAWFWLCAWLLSPHRPASLAFSHSMVAAARHSAITFPAAPRPTAAQAWATSLWARCLRATAAPHRFVGARAGGQAAPRSGLCSVGKGPPALAVPPAMSYRYHPRPLRPTDSLGSDEPS